MFERIKKLQQKPREERQRIAAGVALGITGVIFLVWLNASFIQVKEPILAETEDKNSPFSVFKERMSENVRSFSSLFDKSSNGTTTAE